VNANSIAFYAKKDAWMRNADWRMEGQQVDGVDAGCLCCCFCYCIL